MFGTIVILLLVILSVIFALLMYKKFFIEEEKNISDKEYVSCEQEYISISQGYFNSIILFLFFMAESILLYPFALAFERLTIYVIIEALILSVLILFGLFYAVKNRLLQINDD